MFRFHPIHVSGVPFRGSVDAYHAPRLIPPSSNRTCGFPASGSPIDFTNELSSTRLVYQWLRVCLKMDNYFRSTSFRSSGSPFILIVTQLWRDPLAPWALPRFSATMGLSDSDPNRTGGYSFPRGVGMLSLFGWVSQVPRLIFRRALPPDTPESPTVANACCFTVGCRLRPLWKIGRSRFYLTRPNRVHLRCGSRRCRSRLRTV